MNQVSPDVLLAARFRLANSSPSRELLRLPGSHGRRRTASRASNQRSTVRAVRLRAPGSHQHLRRLRSLALVQQFLSPAARCNDVTKGDVTLGGVGIGSGGDGGDACRNAPEPRFHPPVLIAILPPVPAVAINIPETSASLSTMVCRLLTSQLTDLDPRRFDRIHNFITTIARGLLA